MFRASAAVYRKPTSQTRKMSNGSDFDDFFDSPQNVVRPGSRLGRLDTKHRVEDEEIHNNRNNGEEDGQSVPSSARSNASNQSGVRIEARVPSVASDLYTDSDSDSDAYELMHNMSRSSRNGASGRPQSGKQRPRDDERRKPPTKVSTSTKSHHQSEYVSIEKNRQSDSRGMSNKPPTRPRTSRGSRSAWSDSTTTTATSASKQYESEKAMGDRQIISESQASRSIRGDSHIGLNGKRIKHGRCRYSDTEESSEDEAATEIPVRNRSKHYSQSSSSSDNNDRRSGHKRHSRSSSQSSEWSTGSEENKDPLTPRKEKKKHNEESDSDTFSISSLSETDDQNAQILPKKLDEVDQDRLNLKLLLSALLESDNDRSKEGKKRNMLIVSPNRLPSGNRQQKVNYTFTNDKARMIDLENQRLLNNIMLRRADTQKAHQALRATNSQPTTKKGKSKKTEEPKRVTNATISRMREQQRVERENLALLRRLNQVKPSRELSRTHQLEDYKRQVAHFYTDMRLPGTHSNNTLEGKRSASSLSHAPSGRRSRPQSAGYARPSSAATYGSSSNRPSSAHSLTSTGGRKRPSSATTRKRPEWETGW